MFVRYGTSMISVSKCMRPKSYWVPIPLSLQLLQFKEDNAGQLGSATSSFDQVLERTKANMNWVALNKQQVHEWFTSEASSLV